MTKPKAKAKMLSPTLAVGTHSSTVVVKVVSPKAVAKKASAIHLGPDRTIPMPKRAAAPVTGRQILEHAYWLGKAVKDKDEEAVAAEFVSFRTLCRMYYTFASPPEMRLSKMSQEDNKMKMDLKAHQVSEQAKEPDMDDLEVFD